MVASDQFARINNLRLRYRRWGDPALPPVVLLHGGSAHAHWWDWFAAAIADRHCAYALDLRGHGDSEKPTPAAYRISDYAHDLASFIEAMGFANVNLVGHSLGGMVSTAYGARAPERVKRLVVVDSPLRISPAGARYMARLHRLPHPMYRSREDALSRFRLLPTHSMADASILQHVAAQGIRRLSDGRWTLKFDRQAMAYNESQDLTPCLERLRCPILFVRGAHSTVLTPPMLAALLATFPHAQAVEIPAAHHHVMLDNPPAFEREVRLFLEQA